MKSLNIRARRAVPDSVTTMFTRFFTDMFASIRLGRLRPEPTTETLLVEPSEFSLAERRELDTIYTVRNNTKKIHSTGLQYHSAY